MKSHAAQQESLLVGFYGPGTLLTHAGHVSSNPGSQPMSTSSSMHADMFGKSPVFGRGSYFPTNIGGQVYSRYRSDFEEVEFLVS